MVCRIRRYDAYKICNCDIVAYAFFLEVSVQCFRLFPRCAPSGSLPRFQVRRRLVIWASVIQTTDMTKYEDYLFKIIPIESV